MTEEKLKPLGGREASKLPSPIQIPGGQKRDTILVLEDDEHYRDLIYSLLYDVLGNVRIVTAKNLKAGAKLLTEEKGRLMGAVVDIHLMQREPEAHEKAVDLYGPHGFAFAMSIKAATPNVIICSDADYIEQEAGKIGVSFIHKDELDGYPNISQEVKKVIKDTIQPSDKVKN